MRPAILPYEWWVSRGTSWRLRLFKARRNLQCLPPLVRQIACWKSDLVCTNTLLVGIGAFAAWILRKPHVWFVHELLPEGLGLTFDFGEPLTLWLVAHLSTACIASSRAVAEHYRNRIAARSWRVLYPAVEVHDEGLPAEAGVPPAEAPGGSETLRCALVGRVVPEKGQREAVEAVAALIGEGRDISLEIAGDGDPAYTASLLEWIREYGLEQRVRLRGYVEDPCSVLRNCDVLLVCSRAEAFGRVTVEAMKLGKPVIGSNAGATPELIRDGWNGLLYQPGSVQALAEKIRYLQDHPSERRRMGETARTWARSTFNRERYGRELLAILNAPSHPG